MRFFPLLSFFPFHLLSLSSSPHFPTSLSHLAKLTRPTFTSSHFPDCIRKLMTEAVQLWRHVWLSTFALRLSFMTFLKLKVFSKRLYLLWDDDSGEGDSGGLNGPPKIFWNANKIISILFYDVVHDMRYLKSEISFSIRWLFLMEKGCDYFMKKISIWKLPEIWHFEFSKLKILLLRKLSL